MIFARIIIKMPEFFTLFARKYFFPIFLGGSEHSPPAPRPLRLCVRNSIVHKRNVMFVMTFAKTCSNDNVL